MKLKTKLLGGFVFCALVPLAASSYMIHEKAASMLKSKTTSHLQTNLIERKESVSQYFKNIDHQIDLMAADQTVVEAMENFSKSFKIVGENTNTTDSFDSSESIDINSHRQSVQSYYNNQFSSKLSEFGQEEVNAGSLIPTNDTALILQSLYIAQNSHPLGSKNNLVAADDNSSYSQYHGKYHSYFNKFLTTYGFYDVFLVEPENGNIVYSVYKEVDYATSLRTGPYSNSGIGKAFEAAMQQPLKNQSTLIEFSNYLPSYNQPASFISKPILNGSKVVGVLIYQMPLENISNIVNSRTGLGESGKSYLVGEDGLLRTQIPFTDENSIFRMKADTELLSATQVGQALSPRSDFLGNEVVTLVDDLNLLGIDWKIVVEQDSAEAYRTLQQLDRLMLIILCIGGLIAVVVAFFITRNTLRQLGAEPDTLNEISNEIADGDLSREFSEDGSETGTLRAMVGMQNQLKDRVKADQVAMTRISRMRDGLEKLTTPIALTSSDNRISFVNAGMREFLSKHNTDIRSVIPAFNESNVVGLDVSEFSDDSAALARTIENLESDYSYELSAGSRTIRIILNAIKSDSGERLGTALELFDITAEREVLKEVDCIIRGANNGDLTSRIGTHNKSGVYLGLSESVNGLLDLTQGFVGDISRFLGAIADGDLSQGIDKEYNGTFAEVKRDANRSVTNLKKVVEDIRSVASTVDTAAREINTGNTDLSQRTERAAASLEETSSSMAEMTDSVTKNADNSKQANQLALAARDQAEKGGMVVGEAVTAMASINESSRKISDIIGVIDDIAFQTNLLALNASVEAARAGEQGRGFAVVASEVRNLAGRSATAAKEIKDLIEDSVNRVENGAELVNESGRTLDEIVAQVKKVNDIVSEISSASQEQSEGIGLVNNAISELDDATQQNAALVEQASAASQSTTTQAENLIKLIGFFSTSDKSLKSEITPLVQSGNGTENKIRQVAKPGRKSANSSRHLAPARIANSDQDPDWEEF